MPSSDDLEWINIDDFSPGIHKSRSGIFRIRLNEDGSENKANGAPLGACQEEYTFSCMSAIGGALIPAPGVDATFDQAMLGTGTRPEGSIPILASHYIGPIWPNNASPIVTPPTYPDGLFIAYGQYLDPASGSNYDYRLDAYYYKCWGGLPPATIDLYGVPSVFVDMNGPVAWAAPWIHAAVDYADIINASPLLKQVAMFRHVPRAELVAGSPQFLSMFPSEALPGADSLVAAANNIFLGTQIVGHAGRLVGVYTNSALFASGEQFGLSAAIIPGANDLTYYPPRDAEDGTPTSITRPVEENQSGIRVIASMNANELVFVKATGGGAVITGDLGNPTIKRMPGLHSVGDLQSKPIATPLGLVYGGEEGVYLWAGNDTSERISKQIDGPFWLPDESYIRYGHRGQFTYLDPYVIAPNGYFYDTDAKGWWRLLNTDLLTGGRVFHAFHATVDGHLWGIANMIADTETTVGYHFSHDNPAGVFSWHSHPILPHPGHDVNVREIRIVAEGTGDILLFATSDTTTDVLLQGITITTSTDRPKVYRIPCSIHTESFALLINSTGDGGPAPTIHEIGFGFSRTYRTPGTFV